jgi:hypothetical protein
LEQQREQGHEYFVNFRLSTLLRRAFPLILKRFLFATHVFGCAQLPVLVEVSLISAWRWWITFFQSSP